MAPSVTFVAFVAFGLTINSTLGLPALETLEGDFEHELQDLLEGTKLPFEPTAVPPSCHEDVQNLCVHSTNALHQMMWLNCLHDRKADMSSTCLEDYVRTLPFVCKNDEARFCEAQEKKRLQCLFGVVRDVSGRCRLSVEIASIVLRQRKAKEAAAPTVQPPTQWHEVLQPPTQWHEVAEKAIEEKHKKEAVEARVAQAAAAHHQQPAPAVLKRSSPVPAPAPAAAAAAEPGTAQAQEETKQAVVAWLAKARWIFGLAVMIYMLAFFTGPNTKRCFGRRKGFPGETTCLMNIQGDSYGARAQIPL
eukprot:TRINITY_DN413_c0_g1_i1.p2 TRINITY_DN413_c0_g1~~TRINITY_DN413_c0_g1_i1.p2  ORF type:complete len:305 (-),score=78.17 TRINITY_DN413_c0_g1_i1:84-998(-)